MQQSLFGQGDLPADPLSLWAEGEGRRQTLLLAAIGLSAAALVAALTAIALVLLR